MNVTLENVVDNIFVIDFVNEIDTVVHAEEIGLG